MSTLPPMRIGNVIRGPDSQELEIVTGVTQTIVNTVYFGLENASSTHLRFDHDRNEPCYCGADEACPQCKGHGLKVVRRRGYDHCQVVAPTVRDYILTHLLRGMGL